MDTAPKPFLDWNDVVQSLGQASAQALHNGLTATSHQIERAIAHILQAYEQRVVLEQRMRGLERQVADDLDAKLKHKIDLDGADVEIARLKAEAIERMVKHKNGMDALEGMLDFQRGQNYRLTAALAKAPCQRDAQVRADGVISGNYIRGIYSNRKCGHCDPCKARAAMNEGKEKNDAH